VSAAITEVVPRAAVRPLQLAVLRPGQLVTPEDLVDEPGAFYVAAFTADGLLAGAATMLPERYPLPVGASPGPGRGWRLRGMATDPPLRGQGFGEAVLTRAMAEAAARGGAYTWCNARSTAVPFYERLGFRREGEEFVITLPDGTEIPHYLMWTLLGPAAEV
jgi:ribosomal protein S18 acetylase RimI-like enzyme